jgi:hypothetical protein
MSSNDPDDSTGNEAGPNSLLEQVNQSGQPITFACEYQTGSDPLNGIHNDKHYQVVTVEQFYDLVFPCTSDTTAEKLVITSYIEKSLLMDAAFLWSILPDGDACTDPESSAYGAWLFGVSSEGPDELVTDFGCQVLSPNATKNECCQVVRAEMQFLPTGDFNISSLQQFIRDRLNTGETTSAVQFRTAAIHPVFKVDAGDAARANLDEPNRVTGGAKAPSGSATSQTSQSLNREITVAGGFVIAMMTATCFGVFFLVYRRFRKRRVSATATASGKDDDFCGSTMDNGPSCEDSDFQVTIVNDSNDNRQLSRQFGSSTAPAMNHTSNNRTSNLMLFDLPLDDDDYPPAKYTFDLSDTFKQNIMGTYAPTTMQVVAPYPMMEDTSCDSEVDSWAQTDGTVGSLEDRLEEITAEI